MMVTGAKDILEELEINSILSSLKLRRAGKFKDLTKEGKKVLELLQDQSLQFDEIVKRTGFTSSQLSVLLSLMAMKGIVKSLDAGFFALTI